MSKRRNQEKYRSCMVKVSRQHHRLLERLRMAETVLPYRTFKHQLEQAIELMADKRFGTPKTESDNGNEKGV